MGNSQVKQVTCTKNEYRQQVLSKHTEWSAKVIVVPYTYFHFSKIQLAGGLLSMLRSDWLSYD